jgi:hypothetical protein
MIMESSHQAVLMVARIRQLVLVIEMMRQSRVSSVVATSHDLRWTVEPGQVLKISQGMGRVAWMRMFVRCEKKEEKMILSVEAATAICD